MTAEGLVHRVRPARGEPRGALVLLHGRGTSENDLFPLFDVLDPAGSLVGVCPRGPLSLPPGGAHWYVVGRVGFPDRDTFDATYALGAVWLDGLPGVTGVPLGKTVIGGFSQGAVMSYALGLGPARPRPAGILAMSGFIPTVKGFELDEASAAGLPVAVTHGSLDPVIEVGFGRRAKDALSAAGARVLWRESPIAHTIDPSVLPELAAWVATAVDPVPARG